MQSIRQVARLNDAELEKVVPSNASWHTDYRDTAYIYVGGLPYELSEGDVLIIFSQYGNPVHINLVRDKETGKSKGFCFLKYEDQRSCDLAVDNLSGASVLGKLLSVDHTRYKRREGEVEGAGLSDGDNGDGDETELEDDSGRRTKRRRTSESESEKEERLQTREEMELAKLKRTMDDDDPMKAYMIKEKEEEVAEALKAVALDKSKEKDRDAKHRHRHRHHRSRRDDDCRDKAEKPNAFRSYRDNDIRDHERSPRKRDHGSRRERSTSAREVRKRTGTNVSPGSRARLDEFDGIREQRRRHDGKHRRRRSSSSRSTSRDRYKKQ